MDGRLNRSFDDGDGDSPETTKTETREGRRSFRSVPHCTGFRERFIGTLGKPSRTRCNETGEHFRTVYRLTIASSSWIWAPIEKEFSKTCPGTTLRKEFMQVNARNGNETWTISDLIKSWTRLSKPYSCILSKVTDTLFREPKLSSLRTRTSPTQQGFQNLNSF